MHGVNTHKFNNEPTLQVYRDPAHTAPRYLIELHHTGMMCEWVLSRHTCLEYAEAEAVALYPMAVAVNGISLRNEPPWENLPKKAEV